MAATTIAHIPSKDAAASGNCRPRPWIVGFVLMSHIVDRRTGIDRPIGPAIGPRLSAG
jgi:hypothetical protein